ncbi:hypothetical protein N7931_19280 [Catenovulum sp. 2E275]|uniref:hypothetical protein n=1 Tax=Catenovulum sp. 2E275 TaxID=2980497 RepID=UPI0021D33071|nr:hypothetical protein [Catenovulum sp. 2E275]MCU4677755.1 hypothetical protein [Catenovulum sp. 2E275]
MITIEEYPALKLILWDYRKPEIEEALAYEYYEQRLSKWFDKDELSEHELLLVTELAERFGYGVDLFG